MKEIGSLLGARFLRSAGCKSMGVDDGQKISKYKSLIPTVNNVLLRVEVQFLRCHIFLM